MVLDVTDMIRARGFTVPIVYGPERFGRISRHQSVIVFERDRDKGDGFGAPTGSKRNPEYFGVRTIGCLVTIIARSPLDGARLADHEELADKWIDAVQCALYRWQSEARSPISFDAGRFLRRDELEGGPLESFDGAVYEMTFAVARGVYDRDWDGEGRLLGLITDVATETTAFTTTPAFSAGFDTGYH